MLLVSVRAQHATRQHRRQRQRDDSRHENRDGDDDRELVKQPANNPTQKQDRDKHRHERDRHRENREPDLRRAVERRFQRRLPHLHVPNDVLEHDDRIVHDEPDCQREGHQRKVVEAVVQQIHGGKRPDHRYRQSEAWYNRRRHVAQEQKDHGNDEHQRQQQRHLHVVHGLLDRNRAVDERRQPYAAGNLRLHLRDQVFDGRRHRHGIASRLPLDGKDDRARAVVPARHLVALYIIQHMADIAEPNGRAIAIGDDHARERRRVLELAVRLHRERLVRPPKHSRRQIHVLAVDRVRDFVDADLPIGERRRIELHAHGVLLRAVHDDLRHPRHHRDALREDRLPVLVEL